MFASCCAQAKRAAAGPQHVPRAALRAMDTLATSVALVGQAIRVASGPATFMPSSVDAINAVPLERWDMDGHATLFGGAVPVRWGAFLPGAFDFDAAAFGLSDR